MHMRAHAATVVLCWSLSPCVFVPAAIFSQGCMVMRSHNNNKGSNSISESALAGGEGTTAAAERGTHLPPPPTLKAYT